MDYAVELCDLTRSYQMGETTITAVDHINLKIPSGKYTLLLGASGAGTVW